MDNKQSPLEGTRAKSTSVSVRQSMANYSKLRRHASRENKFAANLRTNLNKITKKMQDHALRLSNSLEKLENSDHNSQEKTMTIEKNSMAQHKQTMSNHQYNSPVKNLRERQAYESSLITNVYWEDKKRKQLKYAVETNEQGKSY